MKQNSIARTKMKASDKYKASVSKCRDLAKQVDVKKDPKLPKPLKRLNVFETRIHQILVSENVQIKVSMSVSLVGHTFHTFETGGLHKGKDSKPQTLYSVTLDSYLPNTGDWPGTAKSSSLNHTTPELAMYYAYRGLLTRVRYQKELGVEDCPFTEKEIKDYVAGLIHSMYPQQEKLNSK